jgi:hemoglobin
MSNGSPITEGEIAALVDRFYDRVRYHPKLGPVFAAKIDDWEAHKTTLRAFWSSVLLTSGRYKGNPFAAHQGLPIQPELFADWLDLFGEVADSVVTPDQAVLLRAKSARIAESLKAGLFRPAGMGARPH